MLSSVHIIVCNLRNTGLSALRRKCESVTGATGVQVTAMISLCAEPATHEQNCTPFLFSIACASVMYGGPRSVSAEDRWQCATGWALRWVRSTACEAIAGSAPAARP
jgi:hypothetical protein